MSLTLEDIAQLAGVSKATVSRVVNNYPFVRPEVRERVQRIVKEHNYSPFPMAKVAPQRTRNIGLFLRPSAQNAFGDEAARALERALARECERGGYFLSRIMDDSEEKTPAERKAFYRRVVASHACDGFIVVVAPAFDPLLAELAQNAAPAVLIGEHARFAELPSVPLREAEAAQKAAAQLLERGRAGMLVGPLGFIPMQNRLAGYKAALKAAHADRNSFRVMEILRDEEAVSQMQDWPVEAVFAATPALAQAARRFCSGAVREIKTIEFGRELPALELVCQTAMKALEDKITGLAQKL